MKIAIATPILYDETSPFNHLFKDIIAGFVAAGHTVTRLVATESMNDDAYTMGLSEGVTYVPFVRKRAQKSHIIVRYLRDTLMNMRMARDIRRSAADVLFEDVSYSSFWAVRAAKKKGMRVVAMLQDVWPDNAVQSGLIGEGSLIYRFFELWQRYVYKHADAIVCISEDMRDFIADKGVARDKIRVIYNWGYGDEPVGIPWEDNAFVRKYALSADKFYAVYAGNIGRMQNVSLIVEAAKRLADNSRVQFLIVGDGVMREEIAAMVEGMTNVTMLPFQPAELATAIYSMAGVNIIPLVPNGLKTALPSKIGVCLSCGNPIIACVDAGSKLQDMFAQYGCGMIVDPRDAADLAQAIVRQSEQPPQKQYACFADNFVRSRNIAAYSECIP